MTDGEVRDAIEASLGAQGRGEAVIEPRMHLVPDRKVHGHLNVLRGYIGPPLHVAGVKTVGDYVDNYKVSPPSEMAILNPFDPRLACRAPSWAPPRSRSPLSLTVPQRTWLSAATSCGLKRYQLWRAC